MKNNFKPGWILLAIFSILIFIMGIRGIFSKNYAKDIQPHLTITERENVSDIIDLEERDGEGWFIFNGEKFPASQIAAGDVILSDGSRLHHTELGEIFLERDTVMTDHSLVKKKRHEQKTYRLKLFGGIIACLIALIMAAILWSELSFYFYERKGKA